MYKLSLTKAEKEREKKKRRYSRPGPTLRQFYVVIVWAPGKRNKRKQRSDKERREKEEREKKKTL